MSSYIHTDIPAVERPAFFDGQMLNAADLGAAQEYHQQMRWLHNRSLHTWGIASGLQVGGKRGERKVSVQPGLALDSLGRELILSSAESLAIPAVPGPLSLYLTASYLEDAEIAPSALQSGLCYGTGAVRRPEKVLLRFQDPLEPPANPYRPGLDVLLAEIEVENCRLAAAPGLAGRRDARPGARPALAGGITPSPTAWTVLKSDTINIGMQTEVDTRSAGFGATPTYMAHVVGNRELEPGKSYVDGFTFVSQPSAAGFVLQVLLTRSPGGSGITINPVSVFTNPAGIAAQLGWRVSWMGVEG